MLKNYTNQSELQQTTKRNHKDQENLGGSISNPEIWQLQKLPYQNHPLIQKEKYSNSTINIKKSRTPKPGLHSISKEILKIYNHKSLGQNKSCKEDKLIINGKNIIINSKLPNL